MEPNKLVTLLPVVDYNPLHPKLIIHFLIGIFQQHIYGKTGLEKTKNSYWTCRSSNLKNLLDLTVMHLTSVSKCDHFYCSFTL